MPETGAATIAGDAHGWLTRSVLPEKVTKKKARQDG